MSSAVLKRLEGKGFDTVHTALFTEGEVTLSAIEQAKRMAAGAGVDDTVIIYISGHGVGLSTDKGGEYYFIKKDTMLADIEQTGIPYSSLEEIFDGTKARNRLLFLDTCESGEEFAGSGGGAMVAAAARDDMIPMDLGRQVVKNEIPDVVQWTNREDRYNF